MAKRQPLIGNNQARSITATKPSIAITVIRNDTLRIDSRRVIPLMRLITQNPLSFIHGNGFEPQPIAIARYTG